MPSSISTPSTRAALLFIGLAGVLPGCGPESAELATEHDVMSVLQYAQFMGGGFDNGAATGNVTAMGAGSTGLPGWTIGGGGIDYVYTTYFQAASGSNYSLDLNNWSPGSISQSFDTQPGVQYKVGFSLSGNPYCGASSVKSVRVTAADIKNQDYHYDMAAYGTTAADMKWVRQQFIFTANSATTTLTFTSLSNGACGPALDSVTVSAI
jgi:choice-of-anchor C domain-containing protein